MTSGKQRRPKGGGKKGKAARATAGEAGGASSVDLPSEQADDVQRPTSDGAPPPPPSAPTPTETPGSRPAEDATVEAPLTPAQPVAHNVSVASEETSEELTPEEAPAEALVTDGAAPTEPIQKVPAGEAPMVETSAEVAAPSEPVMETAQGAPADPTPGSSPTAPADANVPDVSPVTGRRRLLDALRPRLSVGQIVAGLLCAVLAFAAVQQVRSTDEAELTSLRVEDLVGVMSEMDERQARLDSEARDLIATRDRLLAGDGQEAQQDVRRQIDRYEILAGLVPAVGPGVEVTIADPTGQVQADQLLDAVQELRGAGAEAISLGDVRLVESSAFVDRPGGISVDGRPVAAPYRIKAIGDPRSLATALDIPGGVNEVLRLQYDATVDVRQQDRIRIDSVRQAAEQRHARPVPDDER